MKKIKLEFSPSKGGYRMLIFPTPKGAKVFYDGKLVPSSGVLIINYV